MISPEAVRFELVKAEATETSAIYDATVTTSEGVGTARVYIEGASARIDGVATGISEAHTTQLLAIGRTIGRRADEGWPRRIHRWRAPGVR